MRTIKASDLQILGVLCVLAVYFFFVCCRKPRQRDVRIFFWNQDSGGRNNTDEYLSERPLNPSRKSVAGLQDGPASGGKMPHITAFWRTAAVIAPRSSVAWKASCGPSQA
jgi:hypothetical protein